MTTAELKDAAIFVMAYSFLKMDSSEELGLFINKKASKFIDDLIEAMTPILAEFYAENKDKIAYISNKSCDTKYRKEAEDSQTLAYFYIENI